MQKTTVYVIRHAQAAGNKKKVFQGRTDAALSELGEKQLAALTQYCQTLSFDAVYTSPLLRAVQTAQAVNVGHGLPIQKEPGLIEIDGGDFENRPWQELPDFCPEQYTNWDEFPWRFQAPHGESMRQVYERMKETTLRLVRENRGKSMVLVSHGCALRNLLCWVSGYELEQIGEIGWCDNASVSRVDFDEQDVPHIVYCNDVSHLVENGVMSKWFVVHKDGNIED